VFQRLVIPLILTDLDEAILLVAISVTKTYCLAATATYNLVFGSPVDIPLVVISGFTADHRVDEHVMLSVTATGTAPALNLRILTAIECELT